MTDEAASIQWLHLPGPMSLGDHISMNERSPNRIATIGYFESVHASRHRFATIDGHEGTRCDHSAVMIRKPRWRR